jgi:DNA polymerase I-like protein with 3'-5' exonuclease and polymerase domains
MTPKIGSQTKREVLELVLRFGRLQKFKEDYERLAPGDDGKIRSVQSPLAWTGRMTHRGTFLERSTNLANISEKYGILDPIFNLRDVLVPEPGRMLGYVDLSQAEARVAAWESGDDLAMRQYREGVDRYRFFSGHFYGLEPDQITKPQRDVGKMGVLAFQYGVAWKTFMEQVNEDAELTGASIDAKGAKRADLLYHRLYPGYRAWHRRVLEGVEKTGYIRNCFGRRIEFFNRTDSDSARDKLKRDAVASIPQSTIADLLNSKLVEVYRELDPKELRILLQAHDAILFDCDSVGWRGPCRRLATILDSSLALRHGDCHIPAEIKVSLKSWGQMEEVDLGS